MLSRATVLAALVASVVACATIPADAPAYHRAPDPGAGMANVYVYRGSSFFQDAFPNIDNAINKKYVTNVDCTNDSFRRCRRTW